MEQSSVTPLPYGPRGTGRIYVPTDDDVRASVVKFSKRQAHRADRRNASAVIAAELEEVSR